MDISQTLKDTENALRDFIFGVLSNSIGDNWLDKCGVTVERIKKWKERKNAEEKRQKFGTIDERLIYYADFYDIKKILKKHWNIFSETFRDWKTIEVYLSELEKLRDPRAHRRELLLHQKQLAYGNAGELRTIIVRYRSKLETSEDFFPRIESARDNLGNVWTPSLMGFTVYTKLVLRPSDTLEFIITASDPLGDNLQYGISENIGPNLIKWEKNNTLTYSIQEKNIGRIFSLYLSIISPRKYHAVGNYCDDFVQFTYTVLPSKS